MDLGAKVKLAYGSLPVILDKTTFLYQVAYARQETSSSRDIFNSTTAKADYTTQTASVDLQLVKSFQASENFVVEPKIGTTYRYTNTPSYTESGAGVLNLSTDKFTANDFTANAGVLSNYEAGATFNTNGIDNGRLNYEIGLGVNIQEVIGGELSFMYDYQAKGSEFINSIVSARYMYSF